MPQKKWEPDAALGEEIEELVELHKQWAASEVAYKAKLKTLARPDGPVPIAHLAERLEVERKTVYRHLGRSMS